MSISKELYNVKFEDYKESLQILYMADDKFKSICNEYCTIKKKKAKFEKKFEKYFQKKLKYDSLSEELEEEILIYLIRSI